MAEMLGHDITFTDPDGIEWPGQAMRCSERKGFAFHVLFYENLSHPHFECAECKTVYCGTFDGSTCERLH